jgi:hypothetical protein
MYDNNAFPQDRAKTVLSPSAATQAENSVNIIVNPL